MYRLVVSELVILEFFAIGLVFCCKVKMMARGLVEKWNGMGVVELWAVGWRAVELNCPNDQRSGG